MQTRLASAFMGYLLLAVLTGASCASPCRGWDGSCLDLHIEGSGDYTSLQISSDALASIGSNRVAVVAYSGALPARVLVTPPPGVQSTAITDLQVAAFLGQDTTVPNQTGTLSALNWPEGSHIEATVNLTTNTVYPDMSIIDMSSIDMGLIDMASPSDLTVSPCQGNADGTYCGSILPGYPGAATNKVTCTSGVISQEVACTGLTPACGGTVPNQGCRVF